VYWLIGVTTAFITSFYMFRLWFLTFFGEYRGKQEPAHAGVSASHGHGGIHESPKVMLVPLVILAVLSVVGGWPHNRFENFLSPVFHVGVTASMPAEAARAVVPSEHAGGTEALLMGISVAAALAGLFLAWLLYHRRPQLPQEIAHALGGFYQAVLNKYYVDELYAVLFVKPVVDGSAKLLWHGIDQNVIDATVDNSADGAREVSDTMRHMQSGNLRSYAGWVAAGAAGVIAYMVWIGVR
jgi:NADH-quinone oxidoreductase subunit L